jgi:acetyl-CoA acyltransferase
MKQLQEAVIVGICRSAVGKSGRGSLRSTRPDELGIQVIAQLLRRLPGLPKETIDDVAIGCAMPEGEQGLNVARTIACAAGIPDEASAITVNRFCSSGLQTIAMVADRIALGALECGIAGGIESMSMVPMSGFHTALHPRIVVERPELYISMGLTAENVATKYKISREDQDAFSLESHRRAVAAIQAGHFVDEIVTITTPEGAAFSVDEGPRADTSIEALAALRPAFSATGSVTAGNSSQTSDGAAAAAVVSLEFAKRHQLQPLARFVGFATAGVAPEIMGIGPIAAIPKVLKQTGLKLADIEVIELNEAFASQSLAVIRELGLDPAKVNVNGGAIALGHPLGCTGAKLTATLLGELKRRKARYGMVTMCIGGGMGAAGIFENFQ